MRKFIVTGMFAAGLLAAVVAAMPRQPEKEGATMTTAELLAREWTPVAPIDKAASAAYRTATFALG